MFYCLLSVQSERETNCYLTDKEYGEVDTYSLPYYPALVSRSPRRPNLSTPTHSNIYSANRNPAKSISIVAMQLTDISCLINFNNLTVIKETESKKWAIGCQVATICSIRRNGSHSNDVIAQFCLQLIFHYSGKTALTDTNMLFSVRCHRI